jgi:cation transport regulator
MGDAMPEKDETLENLPEQVKRNLPKHAQEIYLKAHDSAIDQYRDPAKRRGNASLEEVAHKVAWAAVESVYTKNEHGEWVRKEEK